MIWKPNVTVAAIIERDGRFLMVEEEADGSIVYNQPAGHLDEGESLIAAVIRETLEETAWDFEPESIVGIYQWTKASVDLTFLRVCFSGQAIQHHPLQPLDKEIVRTVWMTKEMIAEMTHRLRSPMVMACIDDYLSGKRFSLDLLQQL